MSQEGNGGLAPAPPPATSAAERQAQRSYWKQHSGEATVEAMMLDSKAKDIDALERPEVCVLALLVAAHGATPPGPASGAGWRAGGVPAPAGAAAAAAAAEAAAVAAVAAAAAAAAAPHGTAAAAGGV